MNFSTLCTIFVTFSPETSEFTLLTIAPFQRYGKKRHITSNISEYPGPILTYFTRLVGILVGMIIPISQETLLWQPVKFGGLSQTSPETTFTFCFGVRQRIGQS